MDIVYGTLYKLTGPEVTPSDIERLSFNLVDGDYPSIHIGNKLIVLTYKKDIILVRNRSIPRFNILMAENIEFAKRIKKCVVLV
jgi:hypothetical protein